MNPFRNLVRLHQDLKTFPQKIIETIVRIDKNIAIISIHKPVHNIDSQSL
jgi:hypothetical protein